MNSVMRRPRTFLSVIFMVGVVCLLVLAGTHRIVSSKVNSAPPNRRATSQTTSPSGQPAQPDAAQDFYRQKRVPTNAQELSEEWYQAARRQLAQMPRHFASHARANAEKTAPQTWVPLGPQATASGVASVPNSLTSEPAQFLSGAVAADGQTYLGSTAKAGLLLRAAGETWQALVGQAAGTVALDPLNPRILYVARDGLTLEKSTDGGKTFATLPGLSGTGLQRAPLLVDPNLAARLWLGGDALWRSQDRGETWTQAAPKIAGTAKISALAVATDYPNSAMFGTDEGEIYRSVSALQTTAEDTWAKVQPRSGFVSSLTFDPRDPNVAYATYSTFGGAHVWRSTDAGATWTSLDGQGATGLPDMPVHVLVVDPENSKRLFIGTDLGVLMSSDSGQTWAVEETGFGVVVTESLVVNRGQTNAKLVAFTYGSGVWETALEAEPDCVTGVSFTRLNFTATGGTESLSVRAAEGCVWTASSSAAWVTITAGQTGTSNRTVQFTVAPNPTNELRGAVLRMGGRDLPIFQTGIGACPVTPITLGQTVAGQLQVENCLSSSGFRSTFGNYYAKLFSFTGQAGQSIALIANATGFNPAVYLIGPGNSVIGASEQRNPALIPTNGGFVTLPTTGTYTIELTSSNLGGVGGFSLRTLVAAQNCGTAWLAKESANFEVGGGSGQVQVAAADGCPWFSTSNVNWITLQSDVAQTGSAFVRYTVAANTSTVSRRGTVNIAGSTYTVEQAGRGGNCLPLPLTANQTVKGTVSSADCTFLSSLARLNLADGYQLQLTAGQQVMINARSLNPSAFPETIRLALTDINKTTLTEADAELPLGGGYFNVPESGTYFLYVMAPSSFRPADYVLSVFTAPSGCGFALDSSAQQFVASGGTGRVTVAAGNDCDWRASSNDDWIKIEGPASGRANGSLQFSVAANPNQNVRVGTLTIAGRLLPIEQAGQNGSCSITPLQFGQPVQGTLNQEDCRVAGAFRSPHAERYSFHGTAGQQILLTLTNSALYMPNVNLIGPDGQVVAQTATNRLPANGGYFLLPVTGTYRVEVMIEYVDGFGPYTLTLSQTAPGCGYRLSADQEPFDAEAGTGTVQLMTSGTCSWNAQSTVGWITITSAAQGTGDTTVRFSVAANTITNNRTGTIILGGQTFTVRQAGTGGNCRLLPLASGQKVAGTLSAADCNSQHQPFSGYYADRYTFAAEAGQQVLLNVTSSDFSPTLYLSDPDGALVVPSGARLPAENGRLTLPKSGNYVVEVVGGSSIGSSRLTGKYTLSFDLTPVGCDYTLDATRQSFADSGGSGNVNLISHSDCPWQVNDKPDWVTLTSAVTGTGASNVRFTVAANPTTQVRFGNLVINGNVLRLQQAGNNGLCAARTIAPGQTVSGSLTEADCRSLV